MTPAEELELAEAELELLELEGGAGPPTTEGELRAPGASVAPPEQEQGISKGETALRGFGEGASLGLTPVLSGVAGAYDELGRRGRTALGFEGEQSAPIEDEDLSLLEAIKARFNRERRDYRRENDKAYAENPGTAFASQLAGGLAVPIPGPGRLMAGKGALGVAARLGASSGIGSGLGVLSETGEDNPEYLRAGLIGGGVGLAGGGLGEVASGIGRAVRGWTGGKIAGAVADETAAQAALKAKGVASAAGKLGGEANAVLQGIEKARAALSDPMADQALRDRAAAYLADPETARAAQRAYANSFDRSGQKLGSMLGAEEGLGAASAVDVVAATDEALSDPIKKEIWPRIRKQIIDRGVIPGAFAGAGAAIAGEEDRGTGALIGAGVGQVAGAIAGGRASSAFERMVNKPAVRKLKWEAIQKVLADAPEKLGRFAPILARAAAVGPAQFAVDYFVLHSQDPEARATFTALEDEGDR
jgi:hypothetical protein